MNLLVSLMYSCRKATLLLERQRMKPLGTIDKARLWMHLGACAACRTYAKQSARIDAAMQERDLAEEPVSSEALETSVLELLRLRNDLA